MTYEEMIVKVKENFKDKDISHMKEHLAYQFNITGEAEGSFYVEVKDGNLFIEPYTYNDNDAIFTCTADVLFKLISKKLDPIAAFTFKKLKVDGDLGKALKLKEIL